MGAFWPHTIRVPLLLFVWASSEWPTFHTQLWWAPARLDAIFIHGVPCLLMAKTGSRLILTLHCISHYWNKNYEYNHYTVAGCKPSTQVIFKFTALLECIAQNKKYKIRNSSTEMAKISLKIRSIL